MKIGIVSDSLATLDVETLVTTVAALGIAGIEVNTGNWSRAPHLDLAAMLAQPAARRDFMARLDDSGLALIALNCNGNPLHPTDGARQAGCVRDTIRLAGLLGVRRVCLMSGLPAGGPQDSMPNWVISSWPPETHEILDWQWNEKLLPFWRELAALAAAHGVSELAVELHGNQLVYNVPTLLRLRREIGPVVGANLDPSHLFWMGADPLAAIDALGDAIMHVHAKDTYLNRPVRDVASLLDTGSLTDIASRSWSYITLGYGHDAGWWRDFCYRLRLAGYDGWLSIEHEDVLLSRLEGVRRSVELLAAVMPSEAPDFAPADI